ncbi:tetraacyldisaccharide 4'-kinase [Sinimarinibacterium sp. CAU 1509]|uniref:tetraacyldisaccharide 4'-kinase n=1 Tax=Sinimarinibacterium sp. CAU 1509 TaxID=2562283 RepID=UPI0010ACDE5E|nr:tetraacyldisaccharide 4'-kinase [Sinimarinibacterium sp. CAU 1509]TJY56594.1 tetraacyldisaccharide 4'-kinase [Sinimarinibacterium sp. CAU 1509]
MSEALLRRWYSKRPPPLLLQPLAALYGAITRRRRQRLSAVAAPLAVPVIVVGNISVGGTGKTPLVIWLVEHLREWGWRPGVISRGYGARAPVYPYRVRADGDARACGDEPLLIVQRTGCPLMIAPQRRDAAQALIDSGEVDVLVADDGLQHYRLARDLELCVVDGARGLGNGALLPAGPLREPAQRLHEVDWVVVNGGLEADLQGWRDPALPVVQMQLTLSKAINLQGGDVRALTAFAGQRVHAVAGIGHPPRFFEALRGQGIDVIPHGFPDHHAYSADDLAFGDTLPVLMTEKDAVKCRGFAQAQWWQVPAVAELSAADTARMKQSLQRLRKA